MAISNSYTTTVTLGDRKVRDVLSFIPEVDSNLNSFLHFAKLNNKTVTNPTFEFYYRGSSVRTTLVNGAIADTSETHIVVDDASVFKVGDVVFNTLTFENMFVTAIDTGTDTLTVLRGGDIGGTSVAIADNTPLQAHGTAAMEGSGKVTSISSQPSLGYNYTQIFKTHGHISATARDTSVYGTDELVDMRNRDYKNHYWEIEGAMMFGNRNKIDSGEDQTRFTGGIIPALGTASAGTNVVNWGNAGMSPAQFETYLMSMFTYGNDLGVKRGFSNALFLQIMQTWARLDGTFQYSSETSTLGSKVVSYQTPLGRLEVSECRQLTKMGLPDACLLVVDPEYIGTRTMKGQETKIVTHAPYADTNFTARWEYEIITEQGLWIALPQAHGWIFGIDHADASS